MTTDIAPPRRKLALPQVTLCAASSVNVRATIRALKICLEQIDVGSCLFFTDAVGLPVDDDIRIVPVPRLGSGRDYSDFLQSDMVDHVDTPYCMVVQWDGHVVDARKWRPEFLEHDYIGARWPQFDDGHNVGNGGFSLRSRRLMEACRDPGFRHLHPEDIAIGRINRTWLEARGMRFASADLADLFAAERAGDPQDCFGYHGVFNMHRAIGAEHFWEVYRDLDDRGTVWRDFADIAREVRRGSGGWARTAEMWVDYGKDILRDLKKWTPTVLDQSIPQRRPDDL